MEQGIENLNQDLWSLKVIERATIVISLLFVLGAFFYQPTVAFVGGVVAGCVVSFINFKLIRRFVVKLLGSDASQNLKRGLFFAAKVVVLMGLIGFLIIGAHVDAMAFVFGFSAIVAGIFFEGFRAVF